MVLQQLAAEEMCQDKENSAPSEDSGIAADAPLATDTEDIINREVMPGPSTPKANNINPSKSQKAKVKNPFVKLIRL